MSLKLDHVCKKLKGRTILDDISLEFEPGMIYSFVGENGSGKTMLFRAISGLMKLTSGEISLDGKVLHRDMSVLPSIGLTLENAGLYPDLTGFENLQYLARLKKTAGNEEIRRAIERVGLDHDDRRTYRKYSLGMKQRIVIAQAIMESPEILLLDEPTNALDENGITLIRNIILEEKKRGAMILIADHNKEDVELLSDRIFSMKAGKIAEDERL